MSDAVQLVSKKLPLLVRSKVAGRLIESVSGVAEALYGPKIVIRDGKPQVEETDAGAEGLRLSRGEAFALENFMKVFVQASKELEDDGEGVPSGESGKSETSTDERGPSDSSTDEREPLDFDWMMRLFDAVSRVTKEELQGYWGKILANEVREPGSCSLRTLDILHNLSLAEARSFDRLCRYVVWSGYMGFIFDNGFCEISYLEDGDPYNYGSHKLIEKVGLNNLEHVQPLVEAGLLTQDHRFVATFRDADTLIMQNTAFACLVKAGEPKTEVCCDPYILTKSGSELFSAISAARGFEADGEYSLQCLRELSVLYPEHTWLGFTLTKDGQMNSVDLSVQA